jgi:preprotein translocase subunit SecF
LVGNLSGEFEETSMELEDIITKYPPRQIMLIPLAIIILALIILGANYLSTGSPVKLGVEFTGGTLATVPATESEDQLRENFANYPLLDVRSIGNRYQLQFGPMDDTEYALLAQQINSQYDDAEIRYMGPIYSQALQQEALRYIPLSFLLMAIVVFIIFREPFVSAIVVFCALADILIAAASMTVVGISLSLGTVAALLMLIGYSVDTDILLSMRVLKRKGTTDEKILGAMGTGLMMASTTIVAVLSLFVVSNVLYLVSPGFTRMSIIADMSVVLLFGLAADVFNTWITNAQALRWYMGRSTKARRQKR